MPPVKSINLDNGLEIITSGNLANVSMTTIEIESRLASVVGNLALKEQRFNAWLNSQAPFVERRRFDDPKKPLPPDDPIRLGTSTGGEVVDGDEYIVRHFYGAIHIAGTNPLRIIPCTSDFPIGGDWWL
jgi:hypothetical protein